VNDPALDHIQDFAIANRPFEFSIESETSVAAFRNHILVGYNSSANQPVVQIGKSLFFLHRFLSGFSISHDGGETWSSGFIQPVPGSVFTFGDPSVGVDRAGNFYYASLGATGDNAHSASASPPTTGLRSGRPSPSWWMTARTRNGWRSGPIPSTRSRTTSTSPEQASRTPPQ
jgi:hypothetical protein